jgi:hypothetical protein
MKMTSVDGEHTGRGGGGGLTEMNQLLKYESQYFGTGVEKMECVGFTICGDAMLSKTIREQQGINKRARDKQMVLG